MSDAFACALKDLGVKKGDRVSLYLQNIPQFVIGQFGIWKSGGIIVPLNPMYREKELSYYFRDASVQGSRLHGIPLRRDDSKGGQRNRR